MSVEVGTNVKGTVLRVADYGAIVRLAGGQTGLIHISEIADAYVRDIHDYLNESDEVTVKVLRLNHKGRYELSLKKCDCATPPDVSTQDGQLVTSAKLQSRGDDHIHDSSAAPKRPSSFEDRLSRFLKDSEDRQHDLKRHLDIRRGRK